MTESLRKHIVFIFAVGLALFHLYNGGVRPITADILRSIHVGFGITIIYMLYPLAIKNNKMSFLVDVLFSIASLVWVGYFTFTLDTVPMRTGNPIFMDIFISTIGVLVLFEATRRVLGLILPIIALSFLLYALFGQHIPGLLGHRGIDYPWLITHSLLSTEGVFGVPIGVSARFVFLFVLFAAALDKTGGGQFFLDFAYALLGKYRGGPAKVAVVGSAFMGTMSGSAVANVAGTGCITIPMMKKMGYDPKSAGAIEAVASSGGLIMPPIMGAAAFIMSELLGIQYVQIILSAALPALLYYVAVFASVDFKAARLGMVGLESKELPKLKSVLSKGYQFIVPLMILVVYLVISTPQRAAFWSFVSVILIYIFLSVKHKRKGYVKDIFQVMEAGSKQALPIITACAVAGIVVGVISLTGIGFTLSGLLIDVGGKSLLAVLLITMVTSLILGMGLPVTACYIILAVLAAPAIVDLGVNPIAAHLFIIYFGVLSGITPPVALAAYVGSGIAKAPPMSVALEACRVGAVAFFIPYMFLYNPVLLIQEGTLLEWLMVPLGGVIGAIAMAAGLQGYLLTKTKMLQRALLVAAGVLLFLFNVYTYLLAVIILTTIVTLQLKERKTLAGNNVLAG